MGTRAQTQTGTGPSPEDVRRLGSYVRYQFGHFRFCYHYFACQCLAGVLDKWVGMVR